MLIRLAGYLGLIILSLVIPFLLNRRDKAKSLLHRLIPSALSVLIVLFTLGAISLITGGLNLAGWLTLSTFLFAYSLMLAGLCLALISLGVSGNVSQVMVTLLALLMLGTVFYANPLIDAAPSPADRQAIIHWSININPLLIIGSNFFHYDMLLAPRMYQYSLIQYYPHYYPDWWKIALVYLLIALVCVGIIWWQWKSKNAIQTVKPVDR